MPELFFLSASHNFCAYLLIGDVIRIRAAFGVLIQMGIVLFHGIAEQGQPVVKNGGWRDNLTAVVVPQDTEISKVPIFVVDERVEYQHTAKLFGKRRSQFIVIGKTSCDSSGAHNAPDGNIGRIDIGKQGAFRSGNALPVFQIIMYGVQPHDFRDL